MLNVHLLGRLYSRCISYGTLFHVHSKSNGKTEIRQGKRLAYTQSCCLVKQHQGLNLFFCFLSVIVFFRLLSTANCMLSQMENYGGPGRIFFFLRSLDQENLQRGDFFI